MHPEIEIGPLTMQSFGLMMALAFLAAWALVRRRLVEIGEPPGWAYEIGLAAIVGGMVGARLYSVVDDYDEVRGDVLGSFLSDGGLVWYGGLAGGALAVAAWAWWRGFLGLALLDLAAPAVALGYAIGRIGCQLAGDGDYGSDWGGPWAMAYPDGTAPTEQAVHPTPVYEALAMGLCAWLLWELRDRVRAGMLFAIYLVYAGAERFLVEFVRRNPEGALGLTAAQFESLVAIAIGGAWIAIVVRRHGGIWRETANDAMRASA